MTVGRTEWLIYVYTNGGPNCPCLVPCPLLAESGDRPFPIQSNPDGKPGSSLSKSAGRLTQELAGLAVVLGDDVLLFGDKDKGWPSHDDVHVAWARYFKRTIEDAAGQLWKAERVVSVTSLFAAAAWLPVSVAPAGNLELNFGGGRGSAWLILSLVVVVGAFCTLLWALAASALAARRPVNGDEGS